MSVLRAVMEFRIKQAKSEILIAIRGNDESSRYYWRGRLNQCVEVLRFIDLLSAEVEEEK